MSITVENYPNAVLYKLNNRRAIITAKRDNRFEMAFKNLLVLTDDEKQEYLKNNNVNMELKHRNHSKHCIWINRVILSREAMECIYNSEIFIDNLKPHKP